MGSRPREFYERQGAEALAEHRDVHCADQPATDAVIAMMRGRLNDFENILDVGCGSSLVYDRVMVAHGKRVFGIDFSLNFLRLAPTDCGVRLTQADAVALPFRDGTFDAVVCSETIEHLPCDRIAVQEIARVLKPHGLLFLTVPNLWNAARIIEMVRAHDFVVRLMEGHAREYSAGQIKRLLSPWFQIEQRPPVPFGWGGRLGGKIDYLIRSGLLRRFSKSIAVLARKA